MDLVLLAVVAALAALAVVALRRRHRAELERVRSSRHREAASRHRAELDLAALRPELERAERNVAELIERVHRLEDQRDELEAARARRPLEGRTVIVNTPRPDDRAIRGVVDRELAGGGVLLQGAVYLEPDVARGQDVIREVPAGELVVPRYSFAQIIYPSE